MPTGYTADIKDGISFKTYAMNCARAFVACVELRGEPGGGERIPERFGPSDYHAKAVSRARADLVALGQMTPAEYERAATKDYDDAETRRVVYLREKAEQRAAYEAMLAKVNAWAPPTAEHVGYHEFMRTQIEQSIEFDCSGNYLEAPTVRKTGQEWAEDRVASLTRDIAYHEKEYAEEIERAASRTSWVAALRSAL